MAINVEFTETEKILGYVNIPSGSLLLVDGAFESDLPVNKQHCLTLDLNAEYVSLPIIAIQQHGKRFILIPLDAAKPITDEDEYVTTEDQLDTESKENDE